MEVPIDPALTGPPASKPPPRPASGAKRKARASLGGASTSPSTRVTRRSARSAGHDMGEPARGEEKNLISYEWNRDGAKRARHHSPTHNTAESTDPYSSLRLDPSQWAGPSGSIGISDNQAGGSSLPSGPTKGKQISRPMGYPFGLTPFRYACLTPHKSPPPPGDPYNPEFRPYKPAEHAAPNPLAVNDPQNSQVPSNAYPSQFDNDEAAFHSLTALFSGSPSFPDHTQGFEQIYPGSPGERSDGKGGELAPQVEGRYTMASKADCDDCRNGTVGHGGHWVKSSVSFPA